MLTYLRDLSCIVTYGFGGHVYHFINILMAFGTTELLEPSYYGVIGNVRTSHQYRDKMIHVPTKAVGHNAR